MAASEELDVVDSWEEIEDSGVLDRKFLPSPTAPEETENVNPVMSNGPIILQSNPFPMPEPAVKILKRPQRTAQGNGNGHLLNGDTKPRQPVRTLQQVKPKKPTHIEKPIGGEKNGGKRIVLIKKRRSFYPTADRIKKRPSKKLFKQHKRYTRKSLTPGTVCILLAGPHKGKRVVLMQVLKSGLLLVNGPFKINGCPLRRVSQNYVIATSTKLDFSGVKLPEHINDDYFKRNRQKRAKKEEGDLFATKKPQYKPSEQRKTDQKLVDKMVNDAIRKHPDKRHLFAYLSAMFGLRSSQYPHRLQF